MNRTEQIVNELKDLRYSIGVREDLESDYDVGYRAAQLDFIEKIDIRIARLECKYEGCEGRYDE